MRSTEDLTARGEPILLFDGVCNLCNAAVRFVMERERTTSLSFAPLNSDAGRELLARFGPWPTDVPGGASTTIVLIEDGRAFTRSDAALRVAGHLRAPWSWLAFLRLVPRGLRDRAYDFVSRRRHRWFGTTDACRLMTADEAARFLE